MRTVPCGSLGFADLASNLSGSSTFFSSSGTASLACTWQTFVPTAFSRPNISWTWMLRAWPPSLLSPLCLSPEHRLPSPKLCRLQKVCPPRPSFSRLPSPSHLSPRRQPPSRSRSHPLLPPRTRKREHCQRLLHGD